MDGRKRLPDAELSVMQAVWAHGGEVSRGDIERAPRGTQQLLYAARFAGEVPRVRQPKRPAAALRRLAGQLCCGADGGKAARAERDRRAAALSG